MSNYCIPAHIFGGLLNLAIKDARIARDATQHDLGTVIKFFQRTHRKGMLWWASDYSDWDVEYLMMQGHDPLVKARNDARTDLHRICDLINNFNHAPVLEVAVSIEDMALLRKFVDFENLSYHHEDDEDDNGIEPEDDTPAEEPAEAPEETPPA